MCGHESITLNVSAKSTSATMPGARIALRTRVYEPGRCSVRAKALLGALATFTEHHTVILRATGTHSVDICATGMLEFGRERSVFNLRATVLASPVEAPKPSEGTLLAEVGSEQLRAAVEAVKGCGLAELSFGDRGIALTGESDEGVTILAEVACTAVMKATWLLGRETLALVGLGLRHFDGIVRFFADKRVCVGGLELSLDALTGATPERCDAARAMTPANVVTLHGSLVRRAVKRLKSLGDAAVQVDVSKEGLSMRAADDDDRMAQDVGSAGGKIVFRACVRRRALFSVLPNLRGEVVRVGLSSDGSESLYLASDGISAFIPLDATMADFALEFEPEIEEIEEGAA